MGFLDPGQPIVERLRARFAAAAQLVDVYTAVDGGAILDAALARPAVYVIFDGYQPAQEVGHGVVQQIAQVWAAIVKVRHTSGPNLDDGAPMHAEAAPVIDVVLRALCGWRPCEGFDGFRMETGEGPKLMSGYAYHPLFFSTRTVVRGEP